LPSVGSIVLNGAARLRLGAHPARARQDAGALLLHLLGKNKAWLIAHAEEELPGVEAARYAALLERRFRGEPIQYITGEAEFYGLPFRVTPAVLIPRPETEHLVEKALKLAASFTAPRIVDVGCGSGAIAVALAHELRQRSAKRLKAMKGTALSPCINSADLTEAMQAAEKLAVLKGNGFSRAVNDEKSAGALAPEESCSENLPETITAIDLSTPALAIARENAHRNGVSECIRFLSGDLLKPAASEQFEMVVSNPPYVPANDRATLSVEVRGYEPELALFAGGDGLSVYRRLIPAAFDALIPGGFLLMEIGFGQSQAVGELLARSGFGQIEFVPDLQGILRVASARRPLSV
jgi:release factor-specific protein-(glutamine-N5) methyltransferase